MSDYDYSLCSYVQLAMTNEDFRKIRNFPLTRGGELAEIDSDPLMMTVRKKLPNGKWITQKLNSSTPADIAKADPESIWETGDGRQILPKDMDLKHLINIMNFLRARLCKQTNVPRDAVDRLTRQAEPIFKHLEAEIQRRANGVPRETRTGRKIILED